MAKKGKNRIDGKAVAGLMSSLDKLNTSITNIKPLTPNFDSFKVSLDNLTRAVEHNVTAASRIAATAASRIAATASTGGQGGVPDGGQGGVPDGGQGGVPDGGQGGVPDGGQGGVPADHTGNTPDGDQGNNRVPKIDLLSVGVTLFTNSLAALGKSFEEIQNLNRRLLAVGVDNGREYANANVSYSKSAEMFSTGLNDMRVALAANEAGMRSSAEGTTALLTSQRLLGASDTRTAAAIGLLTAGTGQSTEQVGKLSNNVLNLSQIFNIKADALIGALGQAAESITIGLMSGAADRIMQGLAAMAAAVGPNLAGPLVGALDKYLGSDGFIVASMLGMADERRSAQEGGDITGFAVGMAQKMREQFDNLSKDADPSIAIDMFTNQYGAQSLDMIKSLNEIEKKAEDAGMTLEQFLEQQRAANDEAKIIGLGIDKAQQVFSDGFGAFTTIFTEAFNGILGFISESPLLMGILKVVGVIAGVLSSMAVVLGSILVFNMIRTALAATSGTMAAIRTILMAALLSPILWIAGAIMLLAGLFAVFSRDSSDTKKHTGDTADNTKKEDKKEFSFGSDFTGSKVKFNLGSMGHSGDLRSASADSVYESTQDYTELIDAINQNGDKQVGATEKNRPIEPPSRNHR